MNVFNALIVFFLRSFRPSFVYSDRSFFPSFLSVFKLAFIAVFAQFFVGFLFCVFALQLLCSLLILFFALSTSFYVTFLPRPKLGGRM